MTVGMQQPYFFPYLGYWQMVNAVDTFIIADDAHMIQYGWVHQNRILIRHGQPLHFRLNLMNKKSAYQRPICEVSISHNERGKWLSYMNRILHQNYCRAPFYNETMNLVMPLIEKEETNLSNYLAHQIKTIAQHLDIRTEIIRSKDILSPEEYNIPVVERIRLLRDRLGFDTWLSLSNGAHYYTKEMMAEIGIDIRFHQFDSTLTYSQIGVKEGEPHVPFLSIIDVLMNCGKEGTKQLLNKYTVI